MVMFSVPRVWEKIEEKMKATGAQASPTKKKIAAWAKKIGYKASIAKQTGGKMPGKFWLANKYEGVALQSSAVSASPTPIACVDGCSHALCV